MKVADGQALLKVSDDKVSAIHGGDKSDYSILEMYELFTKTSDYLNDNFSDVKYAGGFYDHSIVTALWTLDGNDELIKTYKDLLAMHSVKMQRFKSICTTYKLRRRHQRSKFISNAYCGRQKCPTW